MHHTLANGTITCDMALALKKVLMEAFTKGSGSRINGLVQALNIGQTAHPIGDSTSMELNMGLASSHGAMVHTMKAITLMIT